MDLETLFWIIIVFVGVIWNLITKILQRMSTPPLPQQNDYEVQDYVELSHEDMEETRVYEQDYGVRVTPSVTYLVDKKKAEKSPAPVSPMIEKPVGRKCAEKRIYSVQKLREAIIWSEILAKPKALRDVE